MTRWMGFIFTFAILYYNMCENKASSSREQYANILCFLWYKKLDVCYVKV